MEIGQPEVIDEKYNPSKQVTAMAGTSADVSPAAAHEDAGGERRGGEVGAADFSQGVSLQRTFGAPKFDIKSAAQSLAVQPVPNSRPDLWGMLSALSDKARSRPQGSHIMLHTSEHILGRIVKDVCCRIESPNVSGRHCTVCRKIATSDGRTRPFNRNLCAGEHVVVTVKDFSSNGTYINHQRLQKNGAEVQLQHGDILSLVAAAEHENAFAFVYREVSAVRNVAGPSASGEPSEAIRQPLKRKDTPPEDEAEGDGGDAKRIKGLGSGGPDGPVFLNDVRRLQRSNEELRQQLEAHVLNIEKMRSEHRAAEARHDAEVKEVRASVSDKFTIQIEDIRVELAKKGKELEESVTICSQQQTTIEDLKQHLAVAAQSRFDAEEAIEKQKGSIQELEKRLEDERIQHTKERAEAEANMKAALERVRIEASEELKRQMEAAARQSKQHGDMILALQEADKENRIVAENLRKKMDFERAAVVTAEEKCRRLEAQLQEERNLMAIARDRAVEVEKELQQAYKELEGEKASREVAEAKVASLEFEMEAAMRDLALEKRRLQGARERIVLRETQLRAFHSTAAEIASLQQKQQDQLASMLRTLEDGESENNKCDVDARSSTPSTKAYGGSPDHDSRLNGKASKDGGGATQGRSGSQPMQFDTEAQSPHNTIMASMHANNVNNIPEGDRPSGTNGLPSNSDDTNDGSSCEGKPRDTEMTEEASGEENIKQDWMGGDTQVDNWRTAPTLDPPIASRGTKVQGSKTFIEECVFGSKAGSRPSSTGAEVGYTQLLEVGVAVALEDTEWGKAGSRPSSTGAEVGYTQLLEVGVAVALEDTEWGQNLRKVEESDNQAASKSLGHTPGSHVLDAGSLGLKVECPPQNDDQKEKDEKMENEDDDESQNDNVNEIPGETMLLDDEEYEKNQGLLCRGGNHGARVENQMVPFSTDKDIIETPQGPRLDFPDNGRRHIAGDDGCSMNKGEQWEPVAANEHFRVGSAGLNEAETESRREFKNSLGTADLMASEAAGSWAVGTPASAHGDNDSCYSDDPDVGREGARRISDEVDQVEFAASQVATNDLQKGKLGPSSSDCPERRDLNGIDPDVNASQTTPKMSGQSLVGPTSNEHLALSEMLSIVAPEFGNLQVVGRRTNDVSDSESQEDQSTGEEEDGSREEGEIGCSVGLEPVNQSPSVSD